MFDFKFSLSSFRLCRRKPNTPTTTHFFSPFNPKTLEITYPSPPPTTPAYPAHSVSSETDAIINMHGNDMLVLGDGGVCREVMQEALTVVRWSEHPRDDFKRSMLEMILEKQMFQAKDLEELLQCFLVLNSRNHHADIVAAFTEIWEILFQ